MFFVCFKASAEKLSAIKIESLEDLKLKKKQNPAPVEAAPTTSTLESSSTPTVHDQIASQPPSLSPPPPALRATTVPTIVKPTIVLPASTSALANTQSRNASKSENESSKSGNESSKSGSESAKCGNDLSSKPPSTKSLSNSMYKININFIIFIVFFFQSDAGEPQAGKTQLPTALQQSRQDVQTKKKRKVYIIRKRPSADADTTVPEEGHPLPKRNRGSVKEGAIASRVLKGIIAQRTNAGCELNH